MSQITVVLGGDSIRIDEQIYRSLFDNSVVHSLKSYERSIISKTIGFGDLIILARKAEVPYALFFAPKSVVEQNLKRKNDLLLQGMTKGTLALNSRGTVQLRDIELIVKDILRKQELLKAHNDDNDSVILGCLKASSLTVGQQANKLKDSLGIDSEVIKNYSKTQTFEYLVSALENNNIFVSQSSRTFMPQIIQSSVKFSGVCIKDRKYLFIFLNNKDDSKSFEPEGRRILTLILLTVCLAKAKFSPLSYSDQSREVIQDIIYELAEEILMPASEIKKLKISSLNDLKKEAELYSITPSALVMRLQRLKALDPNDIKDYRLVLSDEFKAAPAPRGRTPNPVNGFKKYNGAAYSKAIFSLIDRGAISRKEARRVLTQNKQKTSFLSEYRMSL
jgi:hypothetical protein